ncbi:hypothetical protein AQUCO_03500128v1 [Aquilegia coerulea]|uniref:F-box domain-containing protein n=1 Tax=Aquilegia coerulea TaxID=218851 RepID=A0A2G5CW96_AQUCA|nr:hypothetical protein AQUCO_03500128v1 [Aquilegia coerulea]
MNEDDLLVDRLSILPKPIIHHILSFLDISHVIQTCVLSRKFRDLWIDLHIINIDDGYWSNEHGFLLNDEFQKFVDNTLLQRDNSNIQKFCLSWDRPPYDNHHIHDYMAKLVTWVICVVRRNVQQLHLQVRYMPPPCTFRYSTSLKTLKLVNAWLPIQVESESWFGPGLEILIIENCQHHYPKILNVNSCRLKYLMVKNEVEDFVGSCELKICAPNLTLLECVGYMYKDYCLENLSSIDTVYLDTKVLSTANMKESLGRCLNSILTGILCANSLTLSVEGIQTSAELPTLSKSVPILFPHLKYLRLKEWRDNGYIHVLANLFGSFSCIETLVLDRTEGPYKSAKANWAKELVANCIFCKLKSVRIQICKGCENELRFIEYLLKNAPVLDSLTIITTKVHSGDTEELEDFSRKVRSLPRASSNAMILFP